MVSLRDNLTLDTATARICADGCLVANVRAARVGIQDYAGSEVDPTGVKFGARDTVKVYRPESEVFAVDSMATFAAAPFTVDHPADGVTADNWRKSGVGEVNGDVVRDGGFVRVPVIVRDATAVKAVSTTHKQLSMGYTCDLEFTPGTFDGQAYDAIQRNIRINHIAAVQAARGGQELKISDERTPLENNHVKTITLDGLPVKLDDAVAVEAAITKLQTAIADGATALVAAQTLASVKDGEIAALTAKLADAEKAATPAMIDARVAERSALVALAKVALPAVVTDGVSDADIRKAVVIAKIGDKGMDDAAIGGAFAVLTADVKDVKAIFTPKVNDGRSELEAAQAARNARLAMAHKG
jgi:uncharacterized protein